MNKSKLATVISVFFLAIVLCSSCATKKKYGCPSSISFKIINLLK